MHLLECANTLRARSSTGQLFLCFETDTAIFYKHPYNDDFSAQHDAASSHDNEVLSIQEILPDLHHAADATWQLYWGLDWIVFLQHASQEIQCHLSANLPQWIRFNNDPIDDPCFSMLIDFHRDHGMTFQDQRRYPLHVGKGHAPSGHSQIDMHHLWEDKGLHAYKDLWRKAHPGWDGEGDPEERVDILGVPNGSLLVSQGTDGVPLLQSLWILP